MDPEEKSEFSKKFSVNPKFSFFCLTTVVVFARSGSALGLVGGGVFLVSQCWGKSGKLKMSSYVYDPAKGVYVLESDLLSHEKDRGVDVVADDEDGVMEDARVSRQEAEKLEEMGYLQNRQPVEVHDSEEDEDDNNNDEAEYDDQKVMDIFDPTVYHSSVKELLRATKEKYSLDLRQFVALLTKDEYEIIKIVNFIRHKVIHEKCPTMEQVLDSLRKGQHKDDRFLQPTLTDDPLLYELMDDGFESDSAVSS